MHKVKSKKNLLHITFVEAYYQKRSGRIGGAGTYVKNIADELTRFGHKVSVICAKTKDNISSYYDGKIIIYPVIEMKPTPFIYFSFSFAPNKYFL